MAIFGQQLSVPLRSARPALSVLEDERLRRRLLESAPRRDNLESGMLGAAEQQGTIPIQTAGSAALHRLPSPGMMDDPQTGGITGNLPSWANVPAMAGGEAPASVPGNTAVGPVLETTQAPGSPRWSVEGFDAMREQAKASSGPRGLLGSSARGFDYDAVRARLLPPEKKHSKTHNAIMDVLKGLALGGMAMTGNVEGINSAFARMAAQRENRLQRRYQVDKTLSEWQHEDWARKNEADLSASAPFTIGRDRLTYNPATGETKSIWHGPADWESYAESRGLKPGTEAYFRAVEDYVLRGAGPSAMENYGALDDRRTANDLRLEGARASNRSALETQRQKGRVNLRGAPTYRDLHGTPGKTKRITATGPGGQTVEWNGKAWVPIK